jgi:hypothetical protein
MIFIIRFLRNLVIYWLGFNLLNLIFYKDLDLTLSTLLTAIVCTIFTSIFFIESIKKSLVNKVAIMKK